VAQQPRRYRRKPLATFEHGTRIYAPTPSEDCYRSGLRKGTWRRWCRVVVDFRSKMSEDD